MAIGIDRGLTIAIAPVDQLVPLHLEELMDDGLHLVYKFPPRGIDQLKRGTDLEWGTERTRSQTKAITCTSESED